MFKHSGIKLVRLILILIIAIAEYVVLSNSPRIYFIALAYDCVAEVASSCHCIGFFPELLGRLAFLELQLPERIAQPRPREVANILQVFLFLFFFFFMS